MNNVILNLVPSPPEPSPAVSDTTVTNKSPKRPQNPDHPAIQATARAEAREAGDERESRKLGNCSQGSAVSPSAKCKLVPTEQQKKPTNPDN